MNHKRRRPKHQRAGCLLCKPHKDERASKVPRAKRARAQLAEPVLADVEASHGFEWAWGFWD